MTLKLHVKDIYLILLALVSTLAGVLIRQMATNPNLFYLADVVGMFTAVHTVASR